MPNINITVKNKIAANLSGTEYICGNSDFVIDFDFDAEWDAYETKTARFIYGGSYQDIIFQGNQCAVPVISNTNTILCGVYAGDLHTTTPALVRARKGILCGNSAPADPSPDVYAQMMEILNKLSSENPVDAVRYIPQELTEEQQKQARDNIQAIQGITVDYWENGGVNDVMWAYLNAFNGAIKWDFLVCKDLNKEISGAGRPLIITATGWNQFGEGIIYATDQLGKVYIASAVLGDSLPKPSVYSKPNQILSINKQTTGDIETTFYTTISKQDDGSYECDRDAGWTFGCFSAQYSVYARLGDEIAPLTKVEIFKNSPGNDLVLGFTLPPIVSEDIITLREIKIAGNERGGKNTVTVTETEVPTTSFLPTSTTEDAGKLLQVGEDGEPAWAAVDASPAFELLCEFDTSTAEVFEQDFDAPMRKVFIELKAQDTAGELYRASTTAYRNINFKVDGAWKFVNIPFGMCSHSWQGSHKIFLENFGSFACGKSSFYLGTYYTSEYKAFPGHNVSGAQYIYGDISGVQITQTLPTDTTNESDGSIKVWGVRA